MDKRHIPAAGYASGLRGQALCGHYADYPTGDHAAIRQHASENKGNPDWCAHCMRQFLGRYDYADWRVSLKELRP